MCVAKALFKAQNLFADHREAKVSRLDDAGMNGPDRNLVNAVAFHLHEGIRLRLGGALRCAIDIVTQRKCRLWPARVPQPAAMVRVRASDAKQIEDGAFHSFGRREELRKTRISWVGARIHGVFEYGDSVAIQKRGKDAIAAVAVAIVGAPNRQQQRPVGAESCCDSAPVHSARPEAPAGEIGG
jgi:hypothetical protein